jgi:maleylpyruvate isomerase
MTFRLYSYWRSSSSWRVRIGLALKGIAYSYEPVNLLAGEQFQEGHRARSPASQVPVLEVDDAGRKIPLVQSMAILEWLDERFPDPPLLPPDLEGRARVRSLAEHVNSGTQPYQNSIVLRTIKERMPGFEQEWPKIWVGRGLETLERALSDGLTGRFCHGDAPGLADCYLVPQMYSARRFGIDLAQFPTLRRIDEACAALAPFQAAHPDRQPDAPPAERRAP